MRPLLLRADNFTPPARTPWGGRKILSRYKAGLGLDWPHAVVGESWEISVEPDFPSRLAGTGEALAEVIAQAPERWLGRRAATRYGGQTPLLVKLLDAADNLSVQVHPADGDPALGAGESGKPESWLILEADPGCGIYLGLREGVDRRAVERCLAAEGPLQELLSFVPVAAGDVFVIGAGTVHAIGRGVTLVEPQHVRPGRRGLTYRFWDWNRRYDSAGRPSAEGRPRPLQLDRSLGATDWRAPRGEDFVAGCRSQVRVLQDGGLERRLLVDWPWFAVEQWSGSGTLRVAGIEAMIGLTCVGGQATVAAGDDEVQLSSGLSCVVPAAVGSLLVTGAGVRLIATRTAP